MASPLPTTRVHALDGLRALAAVGVMAHHLGAPAVSRSLADRGHDFLALVAQTIGCSGVELFFVLSGVVLARPYLRGGRPFAAKTYARRRIVRLYPPYFVTWLVSGLSIYLLNRFPTWWTETAYLATFSLRDWFLQLGILYFKNPAYNIAWWSLNTEILFYLAVPLLLPLILLLPARLSTGLGMLALSIGVALGTPLLFPAFTKAAPQAVVAFFTHASCLAAGLVLARVDLPRRVALGLVVLGSIGLFVAAYRPWELTHVSYGLIYIGVVSRALDPASRLAKALGGWHLVWLGERSYSLFLIHGAILFIVFHACSMVMERGALYVIVTRALVVPLSLLGAMLTFTFVERRFANGLVTADQFWPVAPAKPAQAEPALVPIEPSPAASA